MGNTTSHARWPPRGAPKQTPTASKGTIPDKSGRRWMSGSAMGVGGFLFGLFGLRVRFGPGLHPMSLAASVNQRKRAPPL